ncbi:MAG: VWA domain-containing protein [Cyclobacteriaceae bacterium]|nr:VWA domain-containing protein [Cyclobacteriaceae bacterium]
MIGYRFEKYVPVNQGNAPDFNQLLSAFLELLVMTSGNAAEALSWLTNLDKKRRFTSDEYGMGDFIEDLKKKGYIKEDMADHKIKITAKSEQSIRSRALDEIFGKLKKTERGSHKSYLSGAGDEIGTDRRNYEFGDSIQAISVTESIKNAHVNHGLENFMLTEQDLEIHETEFKAQTSTVLMIDISHSMVLYGEDRITPAKKVAMALAELIKRKYKKDTLDVIVFGNDAWQIEVKDLPFLEVGPYHTNTVAGLELAMDLLRRRKNPNKQIFMITDGKPTCLKVGAKYYKNAFGLDSRILNKTLNLARQCRKLNILITTFMIASDPWLQEFVREFTESNQGKAYYSGLGGLGNLVYEDYQRNRRKKL